MSLFHENIKQILSDVETFLIETLKNEKKLSKGANEQRQKILEKLNNFFNDNPSMKLVKQDSLSTPVKEDEKSISGGSGSGNTEEGEENAYIDQGVAVTPAGDLREATHSGFLEKKQKKGFLGSAKFQRRWCVIQKGVLYYYAKPEDKRQNGSFHLEGYKFRMAPEMAPKAKDKELTFEIFADGDKRAYQFVAPTADDLETWRSVLENGGQLIEEDLYEEVEPKSENLPPPAQELYEDAISAAADVEEIAEDVYEDTSALDNEPPPPARPAKPTTTTPAPPPTIPSTVPAKRPPPAIPAPETPEPEPIAEDIYDEGFSGQADATSPTPPPQPPPIGQLPRRAPCIPLPAVPQAAPPKRKIKINITCSPETDFENQYYGKWDCVADNSQELSFNQGDIIYIISKEFDEQSWWIGELKGQFGLVPKSYLVPAFENAF